MGSYNDPIITTFSNGAQLVTLTNALATSTVGFVVGHRNSPRWLPAATHLKEHLKCAGASQKCIERAIAAGRRPPPTQRELIRIMNRFLGGTHGDDMNVYTLPSHVAFGHGDLLTRRALGIVFHAFATLVREGMYDIRRMKDHWLIDHEVLKIERAAVDNEAGLGQEDTIQVLMYEASKMLYGDSPIIYSGDASTEDLKRVKLGRLKQWASRQFVPRNMRVIMVGPDSNKAARMFRRAELNEIPDWPLDPLDIPKEQQVPRLDDIRYRETDRRGGVMTHVYMLWPTNTFLSSDMYSLEVLADILDGRIEDECREKNTEIPGGIYHPSAEWEGTSTHGCFGVWLATRGGRAHAEELAERALRVIEDIKSDHSTTLQEDVYDRQTYRLSVYLDAYRHNAVALADMLLMYLANGDKELRRFMRYEQDIMAVTPQKVRNAASKYLPKDKRVHVVFRPA